MHSKDQTCQCVFVLVMLGGYCIYMHIWLKWAVHSRVSRVSLFHTL